ncbi:hypothetical protein HYQ46_003975 [Verticillium longisporum]|nr:hypothetical protein HYQ46_003975 [Verticillium longisporum]
MSSTRVCACVGNQENRSPFGLLNGAALSYLLFSKIRCSSVVGAWRVGAGSAPASWLGEPAVSVRAGLAAGVPPIVADERGLLGTFSEYSIDSIICFFLRWSSSLVIRSALMPFFAK